jgi:hypothetical protein
VSVDEFVIHFCSWSEVFQSWFSQIEQLHKNSQTDSHVISWGHFFHLGSWDSAAAMNDAGAPAVPWDSVMFSLLCLTMCGGDARS